MLAIAGMKGASIACELFCDELEVSALGASVLVEVDEIEKRVGDIHHQSWVRRSLLTHSANQYGVGVNPKFAPPGTTF